MDGATTRRVRGWILQFLADMPVIDGARTPLGSDMIVDRLGSAGHALIREEVEKELVYLKDKQLVTIERFTGIANKILRGAIVARITAGGCDLVDGTTHDPGVYMGAFAP